MNKYSKKLGRFKMTFNKEQLNHLIHEKLGYANNNFIEINNIREYNNLLENFTKHNVELLINKFNKYVKNLEDILIAETDTTSNIPMIYRADSYEEEGYVDETGKRIYPHKTDKYKSKVYVPTFSKTFFIEEKKSPKKRKSDRKKDGKRKSRKSRK